jgi:hypothetical protein
MVLSIMFAGLLIALVVNICFCVFLWKLIKLFLRKVEPQNYFGSIPPMTRVDTEEYAR